MKMPTVLIAWLLAGAAAVGSAQAATPPASKAPEPVKGCQGEGCDCLAEYAGKTNGARPRDASIPTLRPIELRARPDKAAPIVARFPPGTLARPLDQWLVVIERGAYVVTANPGKVKGLRVGDRLDTMLSEGEGVVSLRKRGESFSFSHDEVRLRTIRKSVVQDWTEVTVGTQRGYTPGMPFQGCLE